MATIRKLPSGKYNAQVRSGGKLIKSSTHRTRDKALQWSHEQERLLGRLHLTFLDAGYAYCHAVLDRRPSQLLAFNRIDRICAHRQFQKQMHEVTLQDVNQYKQVRLAEVSTTTCRDELMMIKRVFKWYIIEHNAKTGQTLDNPCTLLSVPRPNKPRDRVVTREELAMLLEAMTPQMAVILELAYETAMRRGELLKITPRDLHLNDRFLRVVDGKEGSRDVPLTRRAVSLLEGALVSSTSECMPIFNMAPYSVTQAVRRARESAGLSEDVRFHQLRHSRITEVARLGLNQL